MAVQIMLCIEILLQITKDYESLTKDHESLTKDYESLTKDPKSFKNQILSGCLSSYPGKIISKIL